MPKDIEQKDVFLPTAANICSKHRDCCAYGNDCPATFKVINNKLIFYNCDC